MALRLLREPLRPVLAVLAGQRSAVLLAPNPQRYERPRTLSVARVHKTLRHVVAKQLGPAVVAADGTAWLQTPLTSLEMRYNIVAACEEQFNIAVHSPDLHQLTSLQAVADYFSRDGVARMRECDRPVFASVLWSREQLPSNLLLDLREPPGPPPVVGEFYFKGRPKPKFVKIVWPAGADKPLPPKGPQSRRARRELLRVAR